MTAKRNPSRKKNIAVKKNKRSAIGNMGLGKKSKMRPNRKKLFLFLVKFFIIFAVLNILIEFLDLSIITTTIAAIASLVLGLWVTQNTVIVNNSFFVVTNSCTGLVSVSMLASIIFALKKPKLVSKLVLFVFGAIVLLLVNVPRIVFVIYTAKLGLNAELVHELTWFIMSALVLLIWYYGTKFATEIKNFNELL